MTSCCFLECYLEETIKLTDDDQLQRVGFYSKFLEEEEECDVNKCKMLLAKCNQTKGFYILLK